MISVIPRKIVLIPRFTEESILRLATEGNSIKKFVYKKFLLQQTACFRLRQLEMEFREFASILFHGTEFRVFSSAEWFGTEFQLFASIFVPQNGSPSCFLFRRMVQNGITRACFYFWPFFSSAERFGTELREFSVPRNSRNSAGINQMSCLFRLPRNNFFVGNCQPY